MQKAFNRMDYKHCLQSMANFGASIDILQLLGTFLSNSSMIVRVDDSWSSLRAVNLGVPQDSLVEVLLFNASTNDLESGPGVWERDTFGSEREEVTINNDPISEEDPQGSHCHEASGPVTSTRTTVSLPRSQEFGSPLSKDIRIRNNLGGLGRRLTSLPVARS